MPLRMNFLYSTSGFFPENLGAISDEQGEGEAVCFSRMLVCTYKSTWRYNPEDQHQHLHLRENLRSHRVKGFTRI
jgi:hypothetical protein